MEIVPIKDLRVTRNQSGDCHVNLDVTVFDKRLCFFRKLSLSPNVTLFHTGLRVIGKQSVAIDITVFITQLRVLPKQNGDSVV